MRDIKLKCDLEKKKVELQSLNQQKRGEGIMKTSYN